MLKRFLRSTLFLLLAMGLGAKSTTVDLSHVSRVKHAVKHTTVSATTPKSGNSVIDLLLNQGSVARISSQNYKPANFVKLAFVLNPNMFAGIRSLKHIPGGSVEGFSRFRRLLLFPFHAFW
ncbi:hypothetical protein [Mucilaginibacter paludis]|uniref:Uncharacterized protein n=1 Tax=Mucilaginibacter paludis DSM 18603 TaxID=714943 RepID=H1YCC4_9SPHI|nr:hypothetical protein [Mucilaginibacter paludis]EHQ30115.1 hypothetical protein Mucpa_6057 [Mucilaginibacter paludis DSM 18603]